MFGQGGRALAMLKKLKKKSTSGQMKNPQLTNPTCGRVNFLPLLCGCESQLRKQQVLISK
jgi:hypothetical protein